MCVCDLTRACPFLNTISPNPESLVNNISFDLTKCFLSRFERAFCYDAFPVHRTMFFKQASDSIGRPRPFAARVSFSQNFQTDLQAADGTHARTHAHLHKLLNTRHCSTACDSRYVTCYKEQRRSNNVIIVSLCIQESGEKHTQESRIRRGCLYLFCTIQCARGCKGATEIYPHRTFVLPFLSFFFFFFVRQTQHMCTGDFEVAVNGPPDSSEASTGNSFAFSILLQGNSNGPRRHTYVYSQSTSKLPNITSQLVFTTSLLPGLSIERSISVLSAAELDFSVSVRFSKTISLDPTTAKSLYDETKRYGIVSNYSKAIKL